MKITHETNPLGWPEDRHADIPPSRLHNGDEQGPNPTKLSRPVLMPKDMLCQKQLFQNTREGDEKMQMHCSVANVVRACGVQCPPHDLVKGAPLPMAIVSDPSSATESDGMGKAERDRRLANQTVSVDQIKFNEKVMEVWFEAFELGQRETILDPFGFQVRATSTGGMLKQTFFDFVLQFKDNLPCNKGANGLGVVLLADWHCSRECPQSLLLAFASCNALVFVLSSKTIIQVQPCNCGRNELAAMTVVKAAHDQGVLAGEAMDCQKTNEIFREWLDHNCVSQNDEL